MKFSFVNVTMSQEMISISTKCLLSDPDNFVCICYIPVFLEFNKILFTPNVSIHKQISFNVASMYLRLKINK